MDDELLGRLRALEVSSLCDVDKTIRVVDPAIHAMLEPSALVGPAHTVIAPDDHLPLLVALRDAPAGAVLVVAAGRRRAVSGELFAAAAAQRGLSGIVVDGWCRDLRGLREVGLPVYARGTCPASGSTRDPGAAGQTVLCGGVPVAPGDLVLGDDDGLVVVSEEQARAAVDAAEALQRTETALREHIAAGRSLPAMTNLETHLAALAAGRESALGFELPG